MRVLVCGSREWTDKAAIRRELEKLPAGTSIIHGDNGYDEHGRALWGKPDPLAVRGADKLAGAIASTLGMQVAPYTPDWWVNGVFDRSAGPRRNTRMLREGKPDLVLCFHADLANSKGSKDMYQQATAAKVPVLVITR